MLEIRKEQMDILRRHMLEIFVDAMVVHLYKRFPESAESMGDEQLTVFIQRGIETAKLHNVVKKYDVKRFLEYLMEYGDGFSNNDETLWASKILDRDDLSGTKKMDKIDEYDMFVGGET